MEETKKIEKQLDQSKDASIDFPIEVISLDNDPFHKTGERWKAGEKKAKELVKRGWVKMAAIFLLFIAFGAKSQPSVIAPLYNAKNTYSLANLVAATVTQDTVTNAGAGALYAKRIAGPGAVTIQVNVTKVSGTVAGTITLYGSLDGMNYSAINTEETQTALATKALSDATASYHWRLSKSPYLYYQVGTAGGTTTVYYLNAYILKH